MKKIIIIIILLIMVSSAYALTIAPAQKQIISNQTINYTLNIRNDKADDIIVNLSVIGDVRGSVRLSDNTLTLPSLGTRSIIISVNPLLSTGNELFVRVEETGTSQEGVTGLTAVDHKLTIIRPGIGKNLLVELKTPSLVANERIPLSIILTNAGSVINQSFVSLLITPGDKLLTGAAGSIPSGATKRVILYWTPENPGIYSINTTVAYDGESTHIFDEVTVGVPRLEIGDVTTNLLSDGTIRVDVQLTNNWNKPARNINAGLTIKDANGRVLARATTPSININPMQTSELQGYLEPGNLTKNSPYTITGSIIYDAKTYTFSDLLVLTPDRTLVAGNVAFYAVLSFIILFALILAVYYFRIKK